MIHLDSSLEKLGRPRKTLFTLERPSPFLSIMRGMVSYNSTFQRCHDLLLIEQDAANDVVAVVNDLRPKLAVRIHIVHVRFVQRLAQLPRRNAEN